jgi:hypothetical protein
MTTLPASQKRNSAPAREGVLSPRRDSCVDTANDRWENEGGALNMAAHNRADLSKPVPESRIQAEYVFLFAGLLVCFGLVTLMMTIGARREEAETALAMTAYGGCSIAAGVAVAAAYWGWRSFQEFRP